MKFLRKLHKWTGLVIGIQVLLWVVSGLVMSLLDPEKVSGRQWVDEPHHLDQMTPAGDILEPDQLPVNRFSDVLSLSLELDQGVPVYRVRHADGVNIINAINGAVLVFNEQDAGLLAHQDFAGNGDIRDIEAGVAPDLETRGNRGPYWRVNFTDQASTSIYVSASTGDILARRNSYWRVFDIFWMLHIMDYSGHEDLNNLLVIIVSLVSFWLGLSGFILLFGSFKRSDFSSLTRFVN